MNKNHLVYVGVFIFFLFVAEVLPAKMWLSPEVVDNTESADRLYNISASISRFKNLYVTWENAINKEEAHSYNLFWKLRFSSLDWSDTTQLTYDPFDAITGHKPPNMDTNLGWYSGDNVYLTYSSLDEGYILIHMDTGAKSTIDTGFCAAIESGAALATEDPYDYHVLYLKCPERRLYHKKFIEPPTDHGWSTPTALTEAGIIFFSYDIAVDGDRNIHVVWSEAAPGDIIRANLKYLRHTEAAGWDATATLLSVATTITGVQVEADFDRNVHVIWRETDFSDHPTEDIFYKTWRVGVWSPDVNLSSGDEHGGDPSMAITLDNNVHIVWTATDRRIAYRKWDGDWQPIVHLSEGTASHPFITSGKSNNLYLLYSAGKPPSPVDTQLMLIRYDNPSAHTPVGSDVRIDLEGHSITFNEVTEAGATTITSKSEGSELSFGYSLACTPPQYFEIETTASHSGPVDICLAYEDSVCDESELQILHNLGDRWEDITTNVDTENNIICGMVFFLSEFVLARQDPNIEICDGIDNNHDGEIDEGFDIGAECTAGEGICMSTGQMVCKQDGTGTECDAVPGDPNTEICDGIDNDCDGVIDDPNELTYETYYLDEDGDGYGDPNKSEYACKPPSENHVLVNEDCDDENPNINPSAEEVYDSIDNDCKDGPDDHCYFVTDLIATGQDYTGSPQTEYVEFGLDSALAGEIVDPNNWSTDNMVRLQLIDSDANITDPNTFTDYDHLVFDVRDANGQTKLAWYVLVEIGDAADPNLPDYYPMLSWDPNNFGCAEVNGKEYVYQLIRGLGDSGEVLVENMLNTNSYYTGSQDGDPVQYFTILWMTPIIPIPPPRHHRHMFPYPGVFPRSLGWVGFSFTGGFPGGLPFPSGSGYASGLSIPSFPGTITGFAYPGSSYTAWTPFVPRFPSTFPTLGLIPPFGQGWPFNYWSGFPTTGFYPTGWFYRY
ncbi:MAG: putative metal-binding motif-containing protein [bacterium]